MIQFFFISIIIILLVSNKILFKRHSIKRKLIYSIVITFFYTLIYIVIIIYLWNNSSGNTVPEPAVKKIKLSNLQKKKCIAYINFQYSDKEILNNLNIDIANIQIDTVYLDIGETKFVKTPIFLSDTIKFPENFSIKIADLQGRVIKKYDKKAFFDEIEKSKYEIKGDLEKKETDWNLIIK